MENTAILKNGVMEARCLLKLFGIVDAFVMDMSYERSDRNRFRSEARGDRMLGPLCALAD